MDGSRWGGLAPLGFPATPPSLKNEPARHEHPSNSRDTDAVSSTADLQGLMTIVESKADASKVPTTDQLQAIADALRGKADLSEVPTAVEFQALGDIVQCKANMDKEGADSVSIPATW